MNKLKIIGLSALAGSLAALSAQAGELSVTGSMEVTYTSTDGSEVTGNPIGTNKAITFKGSGELDNGYTVSMTHTIPDALSGISSSVYSMTMGDLGSLAIHAGSAGPLAAIDNVMPTAYEEADHGMDTGMVLVGAVGNTENIIVYKTDIADGINLGIGYAPNVGSGNAGDGGTASNTGKGSGHEIAITASNLGIDGLSLGAGTATITEGSSSAQADSSEMTYYATYAWGPATIGYQVGEVELDGATTYNATIWGVSFNVNDNISLSYQDAETEYDNATGVDYTSDFEGVSAAYNIGALALKFANSDGSRVNGGATAHNDENTEISVSLSF